MRSDVATVDAYLLDVPPDRRACLESLRAACRDRLVGFEESMNYGMPSYARDGEVAVAFASQRQYISLYILRADVLETHRDRLPPAGKGCVRYRRPDQVDMAVVESMLTQIAG